MEAHKQAPTVGKLRGLKMEISSAVKRKVDKAIALATNRKKSAYNRSQGDYKHRIKVQFVRG